MSSIKSLRNIALSAIITLSIFCGIVYTSCTKNACKGVTCLNGGTCGGGICVCKTGIGGNNCQTIYRNLYSNTYTGNAAYSSSDTNFVNHTDANNQLIFNAGTDTTNFNNMQLVWKRPGLPTVSMPIVLSNNSSTGSNFVVTPSALDTGTFGGSGAINNNSASVNLIETFPHSAPVIITLSNFTR
jgi:hypothetical protein